MVNFPTVFVLLICSSFVQLISACRSSVSSDPNGPGSDVSTVISATQCSSGSIQWNYPTGALRVTFQGSGAFAACIKNDFAFFVQAMYDESSGTSKPIDVPASGKAKCVNSVSSSVVIKFTATSDLYFMANIDYEIVTRK